MISRCLTRRLQLAGAEPKEEIHLSGGGLGLAAETQVVRRLRSMPLRDLWAGTHQSICSLTFYRGAERLSSGSGFKVGPFLLTNNHVLQVPGYESALLRFVRSDGHETAAEHRFTPAQLQQLVRDGEPENQWDYAVLDLETTPFRDLPSLRLSHDWHVEIGKAIALLGYHFEQDNLSIHGGYVSSFYERAAVEYIQLDASVNQGNSGGPLLDPSTGEVIGIVTRKATGLTNQFDLLIQSFEQNIRALQAAQGGMAIGGVDPVEALIVTQRQLGKVALEIRRSANVGIGYAYTLKRINHSMARLC